MVKMVFRLKRKRGNHLISPLSALEGSRTPNLLIRSQVLYPIKLQVRSELECKDINDY